MARESITSRYPPGFKNRVKFVLIWFWCSSSPYVPLFCLTLVISLNLSFWGILRWIKTCKDTWESIPPSGLGRFNSSTKIHSFEEFWENPIFIDGFCNCFSFVWFWVLISWKYLLNMLIQVDPSTLSGSSLQNIKSIQVDFVEFWSWNRFLLKSTHKHVRCDCRICLVGQTF